MRRERVVHQVVRRPVVRVRSTRDQHDGQVLGVCAGDRVDGGKATDTECDHGGSRAAGTRVAFGTVAAV